MATTKPDKKPQDYECSSTRDGYPRRSALNPFHFPASGFTELDPAEPIEEELLPDYIAEMYYPVRIGKVLNDGYQVVCKLGYGTTSTVWLARDLRNPDDGFTYVALKIYVNKYIKRNKTAIYNRINAPYSGKTSGLPVNLTSRKAPSCCPPGTWNEHGSAFAILSSTIYSNGLDEAISSPAPHHAGLSAYRAGIIHTGEPWHPVTFAAQVLIGILTDLQPKNLLLPIDDVLTFKEMEVEEIQESFSTKSSQGSLHLPHAWDTASQRRTAFDLAPEVVMRMTWNVDVDIWSVAMGAWDLIAPQPMFDRRHPETGEPDDRYLIAQFAAVLGPPPVEFWRQSRLCQAFWDENGDWKNVVPLPDLSLEGLAGPPLAP
ncbi:hypothetical protein ACJ73_08196 [Blastomyces percursus]|uniref:non-specific serine/threonine protein kinase n=1 Tax=Blastomyces percursus TaxID=1658174 RepID=A0A1J9QJW5_9EURO|nr:hypothetical protein ACJ73_08196 [Blastomyces percursus]